MNGRKYVEQFELKRVLQTFESSLCGFLEQACLPHPASGLPLAPGKAKPETAP
jgi:hypothetical protein